MASKDKAAGGFDFAQVDAVQKREDEGNTFHVHGLSGEPLYHEGEPVTMTVCGTYSETFRRAEERFNRRKWGRNTSVQDITAARDKEVLVPCIKAWSGFVENGQVVPLDATYALKALQTPWLRPQITEAMEDHEGFSGSSSGS